MLDLVGVDNLSRDACAQIAAGIVKLSEVGAVANHLSLMRHI